MPGYAFRKRPIAASVSIALGLSISPTLLAQETSDADAPAVIEEVVVKGIRTSLKRAMDKKRDSAGVVDAITAEDIGDFPDTNLAEALQRVTGVAIDRQRGEGSPRSPCEALAPTLIWSHSIAGKCQHTVAWAAPLTLPDIAAESVSGVEIYKTSRANVVHRWHWCHYQHVKRRAPLTDLASMRRQ